MLFLKQENQNLVLYLKITANAKANKVQDSIEKDDKVYLKMQIKAEAIEGRANREIIKFLSKILDIPKKSIIIQQGELNSYKKIILMEQSLEEIKEKFSQAQGN